MTKILVIDDERSIRNSMKDILQYEGHEVVLAENGMEGLVSVKSEKPDIVFCDIKMPKMEGIEVLERIKEFSADTPVIMISGHGTDVYKRQNHGTKRRISLIMPFGKARYIKI